MDKLLKYLLIILTAISGLFLIGFVVVYFMVAAAFGSFDKNYSASELKDEYYSKEKEISELINYYNHIKPKGYWIDIEFKDDNTLERLQITSKDSMSNVVYQEWNVSSEILRKDSLRDLLKWSEDDVAELKMKLDKANCISVEDGEPIKIGFKRSGLGMYSFNIFQDIQTDRSEYNGKCEYVLVDRKLMLEYGGGAIGPQCFPKEN